LGKRSKRRKGGATPDEGATDSEVAPEAASAASDEDGPAKADKDKKRKKEKTKPDPNSLVEWAKSLAIAFVLFIVIRTFLLQTFVITSGSMEETLLVGDMLVANRAAIGARIPGTQAHIPGYSQPKRGQVWVFDPHHEIDMKLVKRLVGLPGDTLEMRGATLFVNGEALEESYLNEDTTQDERHPDFGWQAAHLAPGVDPTTYSPSRHHWGPLVVPDGHYFMMGDNRDASLDSRYWGPLAAWRLEGRVVFTYFSYNADSYRPFPALREIRWNRIGRGVR
jgi:signal peptidase I